MSPGAIIVLVYATCIASIFIPALVAAALTLLLQVTA